MSRLRDAAAFLLKSGLLAEINRLVLHPRGLALAVLEESTGEVEFLNDLYDHRDDPEGMMMGQELLQEIRDKLESAPPIHEARKKLFPPDGIEPLGDPKE